MRAIQIAQLDGPQAAKVVEIDEPHAADGEVLIDVYAAGVAFPDALQSRGLYQYKAELPFVPGAEIAGVVRSAPSDCGFAKGDRVEIRGEYIAVSGGRDVLHFTHPATGACGRAGGHPDDLDVPRRTEQVSAVLRWKCFTRMDWTRRKPNLTTFRAHFQEQVLKSHHVDGRAACRGPSPHSH